MVVLILKFTSFVLPNGTEESHGRSNRIKPEREKIRLEERSRVVTCDRHLARYCCKKRITTRRK